MKKLYAVLFCVALTGLLCACGKSNDGSSVINNSVITTPYAELTVPETFNENVQITVTSENPYVIMFAAKDGTELFSMHFGQEAECFLGTLPGDKEKVSVYASFAELDQSSENYDVYCNYQESINTIIEGLMTQSGMIVDEIVEYEYTSTFDIKTDVVTMKFPTKWRESVEVEVSEEGVKFSSDGTPLFDFMFVECDGFLVGTYRETPIYIVEYPVETEQQAEIQVDMNVILQNLIQDPNFVQTTDVGG